MTILPDLPELVALRGAAQGLNLRAHRPALARLAGGHRSAQRGRGLEFEEVRPYAAGDDVRNIDWRVTARRGRPHTKLFREERERPVWLLCDLHPGLAFGSRRQLKSALLLRAAAVLGWAAVLGGDRVGAAIAGPGAAPQLLPARGREAGLLPVLRSIVDAQPAAPGAPRGDGPTALLSALRPLLQPGSLVLLLSDFHAVDDTLEPTLAGTAAHADVRLLQVTDDLEARGLPSGIWHVGIPGWLQWLDGAQSRARWQAAWKARNTRLEAIARGLDLPLVRIDTAADAVESLRGLSREPVWAA